MNYDTLRYIAARLSQAAEELEQCCVSIDRCDYSSLPTSTEIMAELMGKKRKNEGGVSASVLGCNANNDDAGRSLNANNAATNDNDNYAGGFAISIENSISCPTRTNKNEGHVANGGRGSGEYRDLPFFGDSDGESMANAIWTDLKVANSKRNLKCLNRFLTNREIIIFSILRTSYQRDTRKKRLYWDRPLPIAMRMVSDIKNKSYEPSLPTCKRVDCRRKTDKERHAEVFSLYDRCFTNLILTIIEEKMVRKVPRINYSNIVGRGILCKDKRFCMIDKVKHASDVHRDKWFLTCDIRKFYQSIGVKVYLGMLFEIIKCPICRWLLCRLFSKVKDLPIGSSISPIIADVLMSDLDRTIHERFNLSFEAAFGDNRLYIGDKDELYKVLSYSKSFNAGRYGLDVKGDWQIGRVKNGFRFCKTWYKHGFANVRSEMRRRALCAATNPQKFAGYNGLLLKTDSKRLLYLIKNNLKVIKEDRTPKLMPFRGEKCKMERFVGQRVAITDFRKIDNHKDSGYYYDFQIISKEIDKNGVEFKHLWHCHNGSFEIKNVCDGWVKDNVKCPQYVTIGKNGNSLYFEEYHVSDKEACEIICNMMDIKL